MEIRWLSAEEKNILSSPRKPGPGSPINLLAVRIRLHAQAWLLAQPHRGLFLSELARSVLRYIRVESKQEVKDRIMAAMDEFNRHPVVHTSSDKLDQAAL